MPLVKASLPFIQGSGFPKSGTAGTGVGAAAGTIYIDSATGVSFVNEGTAASPYWTPASKHQPRLRFDGWTSTLTGSATLTDTNTVFNVAQAFGSAIGQGLAETDSGLQASATPTDGTVGYGPSLILTTTDEDAHLVGFSPGLLNTNTPVWQPDIHGTFVFDCMIANKDDILLRAVVAGFIATINTGPMDPVLTGSGTTISFAATTADDIAAFFFSVELTDNDRWFFPYDKANTNASISTAATGVDTGIDVAAAGTFQRLRIEVDADGGIRYFINKTLINTLAAATLDTNEEVQPVLYIENVDGGVPGVQELYMAHCYCFGKRPTSA